MSTATLGTATTTTLTALPFGGALLQADINTIAYGIKNDLVNGFPIWPGAFAQTGLLFIPNRGVLKVLAGDFVGVDATGWPVLVAQHAAGSASWVHT